MEIDIAMAEWRNGRWFGLLWWAFVAVGVLQVESACGVVKSEGFVESLMLRPLPDGKTLGHFRFVNDLREEGENGHHRKLFPKAIYQIVQKFRIQEMDLSFTQGRWNHRLWGGLEGLEALGVKPGGVELRAQFRQSNEEADVLWRNLTHALSGLFCASINFLENPAMVSEWGGVRQAGVGAVRQGSLPRETVCTENLTPWLKLLPCRDRAGLATLLERPRIHNGNYYSLRVHVKAGHGSLRLVQTLTVVLKSSETSPASRGRILAPDEDFQFRQPNWSLSTLFGRPLIGACPLAISSHVHMELEASLVEELKRAENQTPKISQDSQNEDRMRNTDGRGDGLDLNFDLVSNEYFQLNLAPEGVSKESSPTAPSLLLSYDVQKHSKSRPLNVGMSWRAPIAWSPRQGPFRATQFLTGRGNGRGAIVSLVHANGDSCHGSKRNTQWCPVSELDDGTSPAIDITTFQIVPWYFRLYMHTLKVVVDGERVSLKKGLKLRLSPADDRKSPAVVEIGLTVPRNTSTLVISVEFDKGYLRIDEHPPDANRGFDLPSALFTFASSPSPDLMSKRGAVPNQLEVQVYSDNLLVLLATPDFSMPYNVITFTMTALALYFGSLLNSLRLRTVREDGVLQPASRFSTNLRKLVALITSRKKLKTL